MRQQSRHTFINNYLRPTWERGLIDHAYPNTPNKPKQAYRLTPKGLDLFAQLIGDTPKAKNSLCLFCSKRSGERECNS